MHKETLPTSESPAVSRRVSPEPARAFELNPLAGAAPQAAQLAAIQRLAGNRVATRYVIQNRAASKPGQPNAVLQRMQLVGTDFGKVEDDPIILNNLNHAVAVNQQRGVKDEVFASIGETARYSGDDLHLPSPAEASQNEVVFLHGHGLAGAFQFDFQLTPDAAKDTITYREAARQVADRLKHVSPEKRGRPYEIRVLSCQAADRTNEQAFGMPSFVDALFQELTGAAQTTISGVVSNALSYPEHETYATDAGLTDRSLQHIKPGFEAVKAWLATPEGAGSNYPQRLAKVKQLVSQQQINDFLTEARRLGEITTKAAKPELFVTRETRLAEHTD